MLADAVIITTTDCTKGFWHKALDEESSYLTTFGREFGRFHFTVMSFGTSVAGDVFQRKFDTIFGNLLQVACIADDIMVVGFKEDHSDHDTTFSKLLYTAQKNNVKVNYEKLQCKKTQVDFFGETYTTDGHKASSDKVQAIASILQPVNKKELQSFIGMVGYLSKFTPRLSELAECWTLKHSQVSNKRSFKLLYQSTMIWRSQLSCKQIPVQKDWVHVYSKVNTQCTLEAKHWLTFRKDMLQLNLKHKQSHGQRRNSTIICMLQSLYWRQIRNH